MKHQFSMIPRAEIPRSVFDRSHSYKTTFDEGYLIPVFCEEILPGDSFKCDVSLFARLASPLSVPIMDDMWLDVHFFFVPNRLVWKDWQHFCGEQDNPGDSTDYLVPGVNVEPQGFTSGGVGDYFGLPVFDTRLSAVPPSKYSRVSSLPFRAYNLIWNEWYRDQNLQERAPVWLDDGNTTQTYIAADGITTLTGTEQDYLKWYSSGASANTRPQTLLRRGKRHDYFTSCLPWPQKGPGVELPLGDLAPIGLYNVIGTTPGSASGVNVTKTGMEFVKGSFTHYDQTTPSTIYGYDHEGANISSSVNKTNSWVEGSSNRVLMADLSGATAATINSLRQAFQIQRLYERDARGGTRYTEILRSHFGVVSPDARLQRPEYLGGFSHQIVINPVAQTAATNDVSPQGNLAAYGLVGGRRRGFVKSFVEHGIVLGLASVRSNLTYQQGIPRAFSRQTRFDYYWPALAHLGEQAVLNKEIYFSSVFAKDNEVFGYQERWAEYRYHPSQITGNFRSNVKTPLDYWHLAQKFSETPKLNADFIVENAPMSRVVAVPSEPHFLLDVYFKVKAARPMPVYSVPGLIDHF